MNNALELFSGTKSWGKELEKLGYNVVSLDINDYKGKYIPTHKIDILKWDYKQYPKGHFNIICASPPCIYYSTLQNTWLGRYKKDPITKQKYLFTREILEEKRQLADKWVKKTLEIIEYFSPTLWFMENPQTGLLKKRPFMKDIPFYDVDYCSYGFDYRKRTRIWTNKKNFEPKLCLGVKCHAVIQNNKRLKHKKDATATQGGGSNRLPRYKIPSPLVRNLLKHKYNVANDNIKNGGKTRQEARFSIPNKLVKDLIK